jgi:hypothetical protein
MYYYVLFTCQLYYVAAQLRAEANMDMTKDLINDVVQMMKDNEQKRQSLEAFESNLFEANKRAQKWVLSSQNELDFQVMIFNYFGC